MWHHCRLANHLSRLLIFLFRLVFLTWSKMQFAFVRSQRDSCTYLSLSCAVTRLHVRPVYPPPWRQKTTGPAEPARYTLQIKGSLHFAWHFEDHFLVVRFQFLCGSVSLAKYLHLKVSSYSTLAKSSMHEQIQPQGGGGLYTSTWISA